MKQYINSITKQLVKKYRPEKIILFGSMLSSVADKKANDIDLFLIKKTKLSRLGKRAIQARKLLTNQHIPVDFLIYTPEEVQIEIARGNVFIEEIVNNGKVLYEHKD